MKPVADDAVPTTVPEPLAQQQLLLVMPIVLERLDELRATIRNLPTEYLHSALNRVGTVHSTRFVILEDEDHRWAKLIVVATYDDSVDNYIAAFARELKVAFNTLFLFIADHPALPVEDNVREFIDYVVAHDVKPAGEIYRAYPGLTALDIWEALASDDAAATEEAMAEAKARPAPARLSKGDLDDIQGFVVRGYHMAFAEHVVLRIDEPGRFKEALRGLTDERPETGPFITVATDWSKKPPVGRAATSCVNIGFTSAGLAALGLSERSLASFPEAFLEGAAARAEQHAGETGGNAPREWSTTLGSDDVHAILSVYAVTPEERDEVVGWIVDGMEGAVGDIERFQAYRLRRDDDDIEHFGYADGLSQPTIEGLTQIGLKDPFPPVPAGEFVLGHPGQRDRPWETVPEPEALGRNGSFAAFRVMAQDVAAFNEFIATGSEELGIDPEQLAAKLCGRWRNGEPLVMRPPDAPEGSVPDDDRNMFDYCASSELAPGDPHGLLCPRGAHIRRAFPRGQRVIDDGDGFRRRIVRRGMPYGPPFDPENPTDEPRGLVGHFICASLANQFEYIMSRWLNDGLFTGGRLQGTKDPLTGANDPATSRFAVHGASRGEVTGFPRFVTTRGSVYLFLPSMTALRFLADLD